MDAAYRFCDIIDSDAIQAHGLTKSKQLETTPVVESVATGVVTPEEDQGNSLLTSSNPELTLKLRATLRCESWFAFCRWEAILQWISFSCPTLV